MQILPEAFSIFLTSFSYNTIYMYSQYEIAHDFFAFLKIEPSFLLYYFIFNYYSVVHFEN